MKVLLKSEIELKNFIDNMKELCGADVKFENHICITSKKETNGFTLVSRSGKNLRFDIVVEDNQNYNEKLFIEQRVNNLKEEAKLLDNIIAKTREKCDYGTYKNIINAYSEILRLIEKYDWELKYSEYKTDEKRQVAIWEQNGDGIIRNHKKWDIL